MIQIISEYNRTGSKLLFFSLYALVQHVLDSSAPDLEEHRSTVLQVLQQIGVSQDKINNMIEVWNKVTIEI